MRQLIILSITIFLFACNGDTAHNDSGDANPAPTESQSPTKASNPENMNPSRKTEDQLNSTGGPNLKFADSKRIETYGRMLSGEWRSDEDADRILSFKNAKMKIMRNQIIKFESGYTINVRCEESTCDPIENPPGVCVITDGECHYIYLITNQELQLQKASDKSISKWTKSR